MFSSLGPKDPGDKIGPRRKPEDSALADKQVQNMKYELSPVQAIEPSREKFPGKVVCEGSRQKSEAQYYKNNTDKNEKRTAKRW